MYQLYITFLLYLFVIIAFIVYSNARINNLSDYMLGGRNLSGPVAALGAGASDMSSWLLLALPGAVMTYGLNQIWLPIGLAIGQYLNWQFIAKRLRIYTEVSNDSITIPAFLENRFHDQTHILRLVTAVVILIFFTFYTAAGFVSGGLLFESTFHINYHTSLLITVAVVVSYTCLGGFLAISWIDFFQGTLMFFALLIVPVATINALGSVDHVMHVLQTKMTNNYLDAFSGISTMKIISLLTWGLGYFGQPHIIVRFMAMKTHKEVPRAQFICMTWMNTALYGAVFVGLFGMAYFIDKPLDNPEAVFINLSSSLFNPWMLGILLAAVLSATMSTSSSQLLGSSSSVVEDFYHRYFRPKASSKELVFVSRIVVLCIAVIAFFIAKNPKSSILNLVAYAWAGLGGSFGPVILVALFWKRMNLWGAIMGIVVGSVVVIVFPYFKHYGGIFEIYQLVPAFILNLLTIIVVSLYTQKPSAQMLNDFQKVKEKLNGQ